MNDKILDWAMKIQSIAQSGLAYCKDVYDNERYEQLRSLAAEMLAERTEIPEGKIKIFSAEKKAIKRRRLIRARQFLRTEKFCLFTKITEHGRFPADGAMLTNR